MIEFNKKKLKQFFELLEDSSLDDIDKKNIRFIVEYFQKKHNPTLLSRSFLFQGDAGIGKTFLAEKLLQALDKETICAGCADFNFKNSIKCSSLKEIKKKINNNKEQILFIDDLNYLLNKDGPIDEVTTEDKRHFMQLLEVIKRNPNKIMIATLNEMCDLDERMIDRIEVKINFDLPSPENKRNFIKLNFRQYLTKKQIDFISKNSIGYNYRDLPELIKLAYRLSDCNLTIKSIRKCIKIYKPTQFYSLDVENGINITLKDIIGKEQAMKIVKKITQLYKNENLGEKLGLKRANLLLFHGPAGTGKTFMARALAGEIGFPLVNIKKRVIFGPRGIDSIAYLAKRYRNCVIFIDEAEKLFGNRRFSEDNDIIGEFNSALEGIDNKEIKSIFILTVNELSRLGNAFKDRFVHVKFNLPSYEERLLFCKKKAKHTRKYVNRYIDYKYLAHRTKNMTFRDIERTWNELMFYYIENKNKITENVIDNVLKEFRQGDVKNMMFG